MGQSEYNEAQFEIEKAEAVKEARNAALEEAAVWVQKRCEDSESENLNYNAETIANWIRDFKTLAILLPLLFVFGVAAGESERTEAADIATKAKDAPRVAVESRARPSKDARETYGALWEIWRKRNALGLSDVEKAILYRDLQLARNAVTGDSKPIQPYPTGK